VTPLLNGRADCRCRCCYEHAGVVPSVLYFDLSFVLFFVFVVIVVGSKIFGA